MITLTRPNAEGATLFERFGAALDAEREALLAGDEDRLARAEREKSDLVDALMAWDADAAKRIDPALKAQLRALADTNRRNGLLIAERLGEVQRRRQFFERIAGRDGVYGRDGVTLGGFAPRLSARI
ncbi:MAG: hypothetical protein HY017_28360 [Betaproteobacteria bacterium]|nr:hypothetical protein [Betaproteobacteria bacterium]